MFLGICQWFLRGQYTEYNGLEKILNPQKSPWFSMFKGMLRALIILQSKKCLYLSSFQIQIQFQLFGKHLWQYFALSSVLLDLLLLLLLLLLCVCFPIKSVEDEDELVPKSYFRLEFRTNLFCFWLPPTNTLSSETVVGR